MECARCLSQTVNFFTRAVIVARDGADYIFHIGTVGVSDRNINLRPGGVALVSCGTGYAQVLPHIFAILSATRFANSDLRKVSIRIYRGFKDQARVTAPTSRRPMVVVTGRATQVQVSVQAP